MNNAQKVEQVLAIPAAYFNEVVGTPSGLLIYTEPMLYIDRLFHPDKITYLNRAEADANEEFKQIIPYVMLSAIDEESGVPMVFRYLRGKDGGETRLHDLLSIGVGGHMGPDDMDEDKAYDTKGQPLVPYHSAMLRELCEEVNFNADTEYTDWPAGIIYDPTTPVGRVHLGIAHIVRVKDYKEVAALSSELKDAEWIRQDDLLKPLAEGKRQEGRVLPVYEPWSQIMVRYIASGKTTL